MHGSMYANFAMQQADVIIALGSVYHRLPETHSVSEMGHAGMGTGTVLDFGTPRHTVYSCHGVTGSKVIRIFNNFFSLVVTIFLVK